ncbi:MAG: metallophosphoesterase [Bacteroidia bacterium]|nr:metallophosphoesterase [Bacteroidia bacterium]
MKPKYIYTGLLFYTCQLLLINTIQAQLGSINMDTWTNISGTNISSIPVNSAPNSSSFLTQFEAPKDIANNFGRRIRGYVNPTVSGNYIFWIASNNDSELWLSTTSSSQNKVKIASVPDWTNYRQWTKYASQKSATKYLVAGQKYYIEALHKEGTLGDHVSVGWKLPNGTLQRPIPGSRLSPYTASSSTSATFAMIGDYGSNSSNEAAVANLVKSWNPQFIVTPGDNNVPNGAWSTIDANIGKYYHSYIKPYTGNYGSGASVNNFFPGLGNHDLYTSNGAPYYNYFTLPGNERYYDYIKGDIHFFVINSNQSERDGTSSTSTQGTWLKNKLAASKSKWNIVYFHHSPYASDKVHGSSLWMRWPFKAWGADVVMSSHSHIYERIIRDNFPYFVNGLGGQSIYALNSTPVSGSQKRYNLKYGAIQVKVSSNSLTFKFYNVSYSLIDSYTIYKQTALAAVTKKKTSPVPVITIKGPKQLTIGIKTTLYTLLDSSASYQWKLNDVIIVGENNNNIVVNVPGSYQVNVIKNGSIAISESVNIKGNNTEIFVNDTGTLMATSTKPPKDEASYLLKVYPNPNNGIFMISLKLATQGETKIKVFVMNSLGQMVYNKQFVSGNEYILETIELDKSLPQGIYSLQIMIGNKTENISVVLLR